MTDYLDELLEQQEQEEEQGLEWPRPGLRLWTPEGRREDVAVHGVTSRQVQAGAEAARTAAQAAQAVRQGQAAVQPLKGQLDRLRRAVQRAQSQPGRRAASGGQALAGSGGAFPCGQLPRARAADYAALVDAAFQRDARRYDGPLGLL